MSLRFSVPLAALVFAVMAMAPTWSDPSSRKFGPNISGVGSDSYGTMYMIWINSQPVDNQVRTESRDLISSYPEGMAITPQMSINGWLAITLGQLGLTPAAAYNTLCFLCFFMAFLVAYLFAERMGFSPLISGLVAYTIGLGPYQVLQSVDHIELASTYAVLLFLFFSYLLLVEKKARAAVGVILAASLCLWAHPYFFIMTLILGAVFAAATIGLWKRNKLKIHRRDWLYLAGATVMAGAVVFSWRLAFQSVAAGIGISVGSRKIDDLYTYSVKIWDFILPPHYSWIFQNWTNSIKYPQTAAAGTNLVENTLYPGAVTWILAVAFLGFAVLDRKKFLKLKPITGAQLLYLAGFSLIAILFSISPTYNLFGFEIPTPTLALHQIINEFRTLSRFGYVIGVGLVFFMAFGLKYIFARFKFSKIAQIVTVLSIGVFSIFDFGYFQANFYSDTKSVPGVYREFQARSNESSLLLEIPYMWGYVSWYWQTLHKRRNYGVFSAATNNHRELLSANRTNLDQWLTFARSQGITHLILHSQNPLAIPGASEFKNELSEQSIFFLFARYSYLIPVDKL